MALSKRVLQRLARHIKVVKVLTLLLCLLPGLQLAGEWKFDQLGINPLERLQRQTGYWAFILLTVTLAVTPARQCMPWLAMRCRWDWGKRTVDWNWLLRIRRILGVMAFGYALVHGIVYAGLDQTWDLRDMLRDASERRFVLMGWIALALMLPLALTSTDGMVRCLGRNWKRIHRLVYGVAVCATVHYVWLTKAGVWLPWVYAGILAALLLVRPLLRRLPVPKIHADQESRREGASHRRTS